jgi:hypothetical protein
LCPILSGPPKLPQPAGLGLQLEVAVTVAVTKNREHAKHSVSDRLSPILIPIPEPHPHIIRCHGPGRDRWRRLRPVSWALSQFASARQAQSPLCDCARAAVDASHRPSYGYTLRTAPCSTGATRAAAPPPGRRQGVQAGPLLRQARPSAARGAPPPPYRPRTPASQPEYPPVRSPLQQARRPSLPVAGCTAGPLDRGQPAASRGRGL